jgi:cytochrome c oxidase subunit 2
MLAAAFAWKARILEGIIQRATPVRVRVIGHNWWWELEYPELGFETANELHLPEGRRVQLEMTSVDVVHTLSIPELSIQVDAVPGTAMQVSVPAAKAGEYGGECSQICGLAHNMMRVRVVVQSQSSFDAWVESQKAPAAVPQSEPEWRGYEMLTTACAKCHSLDPGEKRTDLRGPNLAHLISRSVFAGATFQLNEPNLRRWLRDTQAMKAGNDMLVKLPRDDYEAVIEYLLMLR